MPLGLVNPDSELYLRKQLQYFGDGAIDPLIFFMALNVAQEGSDASFTRVTLYESYFRHLLRTKSDDLRWSGWRYVIEVIAKWSLLDSGKRGQGIAHSELIRKINAKDDELDNLLGAVEKLFGLKLANALSLLQVLRGAGILSFEAGRRWRFSHDTFEEYFAASHIASVLMDGGAPDVTLWIQDPEKRLEFQPVLAFLREFPGLAKDVLYQFEVRAIAAE